MLPRKRSSVGDSEEEKPSPNAWCEVRDQRFVSEEKEVIPISNEGGITNFQGEKRGDSDGSASNSQETKEFEHAEGAPMPSQCGGGGEGVRPSP